MISGFFLFSLLLLLTRYTLNGTLMAIYEDPFLILTLLTYGSKVGFLMETTMVGKVIKAPKKMHI